MAKRRAKQTRIPGTHDPEVPQVMEKAERYVELLYERMSLQTEEDAAKGALIEVMQDHDVETVELDGYTVKLEHIEQDKVKVKKKINDED